MNSPKVTRFSHILITCLVIVGVIEYADLLYKFI